VKLPMRPNGTVGYVRPADVDIERVRTSIGVDLSRRELVLYRVGRPVLKTPVGGGGAGAPPPPRSRDGDFDQPVLCWSRPSASFCASSSSCLTASGV
jgi:hypothetical protein